MKDTIAKYLFTVFLALIFSGFALQVNAGDTVGVTDDTIVVGGIADMTGPVASTLAPYVRAIEDYIKYLNDHGGVHGRKIVYKWEDDQWKVAKALAAFRKLNDEGIFALISQVGSTQFAALDPEIREEEMLMIGPGQTTKIIAENPYTYATMLSYDDMGTIMVKRGVEQFKGPGKPNVAIFAPHGSSSVDFMAACRNAAKQLGAPVVLEEIVAYGTSEMASQVAKLKQADADVLMFLANAPMMTVYLRDAARMGASGIKVYSAYSSIQAVIFETVGEEASRNYEGIHPFSPITAEGPGLEFMRKVADYCDTPASSYLNMNYSQGWMNGIVFEEALKRAGRNLTKEGFIKAIESIKNFDTGGFSAPVTYGPDRHVGIKKARFYKYDFKNKELVPVSKWYDADLP